MKNWIKIGLAIMAALVFALAACDDGDDKTPPPETVATPTATLAAGSYTSVQSVTLNTATAGASIYYTLDGSTPTTSSTPSTSAIPISETTTLKAIAVKEGMNNSGVLENVYTINLLYIITGSSSSFTATNDGRTVGTANQAIQDVINGIRADVAGKELTIQFSNNDDTLDIGENAVRFENNGTSVWGAITLSGNITGNVSYTTNTGTIHIADPVSVTSTGNITNTFGGSASSAVYNDSTGAVTITGGTISATNGISYGKAVNNVSTGTITISGGTFSSTTHVVNNYSIGTVTITDGTFSTTVGNAVNNQAGGAITISGGTFSATGTDGWAVSNRSTGTVTISNGTFSSAMGDAIRNNSTGTITITNGTITADASKYTVINNSTGTVTITSPPTTLNGKTGNDAKTSGGTSGTIDWL